MTNNDLAIYAAVAIVALAIGYVFATMLPGINFGEKANSSSINLADANKTDSSSGTVTAPADKITKLKNALEIYYGLQYNTTVTLSYKDTTSNGEYLTMNFLYPDGSEAPGIYVSNDFKYIYGDTSQQLATIDDIYSRALQIKAQAANATPSQPAVQVKSDKPNVEVFVMSYCPYGVQMEQAIIPVQELLGNKANITIKFVGYTMHGKTEINENTRQYCIMQKQPDKYWAYLKCFVGSKDASSCMASAGVDSAGITTCIAETESKYGIDESTSEQYPKYPIHASENAIYGVQGSPTVVLNGQTVNMPRTPEAAKQMICAAFNTPPAECSTVLEGAASSTPSGGCAG